MVIMLYQDQYLDNLLFKELTKLMAEKRSFPTRHPSKYTVVFSDNKMLFKKCS